MTTTVSNLQRLEDMTLLQFNTPLHMCTVRQMKQALECIEAEDDYIHNEDLVALDSELAYMGLLQF